MNYDDFLKSKLTSARSTGIKVDMEAINTILFPFQRYIVKWALERGRAAIFAAMGLGKTFMQVEWLKHVVNHTAGTGLIVCPLAVNQQTIDEARKLSVNIEYVRSQADIDRSDNQIFISNYEMVMKGIFDPDSLSAIVLDESSILKAYTGKTKRYLVSAFKNLPFKLACSATPSPNDTVELGNHAEFLNIMTSGEMLTRWFIRDSQNANNLRLKGHAELDFWRWVASWAVALNKPSDLDASFSDDGYILPEKRIVYEQVAIDINQIVENSADQQLTFVPQIKHSATRMFRDKRDTLTERIARVKEILDRHPDEPIIIWHLTDLERDEIARQIPEALIVTGSQSIDEKLKRLIAFTAGDARIIATKPKIAGHGLNWQHCAVQIHASIDYKFEEWWQAVGRSWRYGLKRPLSIYVVYAETELNIVNSLNEKWEKHDHMTIKMVEAMKMPHHKIYEMSTEIASDEIKGDSFKLICGDSTEETQKIEDDSIGLSISSWPFSDQYMYSANVRDFGNCDGDKEFFTHLDYLIPELLRVTIPGRIAVVHAKDRIVYGTKSVHGVMHIEPFSDKCIQVMIRHGWLYMGRITITTDVVRENTHTHRLTQKEMLKGGERMGVGMPEYGLIFRKLPPHGNGTLSSEPVIKSADIYSLARWQIDANSHWRSSGDRLIYPWEIQGYDYEGHIKHLEGMERRGNLSKANMSEPIPSDNPAVWWDIERYDVLNNRLAKGQQDEKHICPLQLDFIGRCIERWSNPGDIVLDYFSGIASVPYKAIEMGRFGLGIELKEEYHNLGVRYCREKEHKVNAPTLFSLRDTDEMVS